MKPFSEINLALLTELLQGMEHSKLHNYIIPGLTSSMIGGGKHGKIRLFTASREQHNGTTPHSHRFDLMSFVLRGTANNAIWREDISGDQYAASTLIYNGRPGQYRRVKGKPYRWAYEKTRHNAGEMYFMTHDQIHSITFSNDAIVLIFEGPEVTSRTTILEPFTERGILPMTVQPWMFTP